MKTPTRIQYRIVYTFNGVKNGRAETFTVFADANRAAMRKVAETGKGCRVYAGLPGAWTMDLLADYVPGSAPGAVVSVPVVPS